MLGFGSSLRDDMCALSVSLSVDVSDALLAMAVAKPFENVWPKQIPN